MSNTRHHNDGIQVLLSLLTMDPSQLCQHAVSIRQSDPTPPVSETVLQRSSDESVQRPEKGRVRSSSFASAAATIIQSRHNTSLTSSSVMRCYVSLASFHAASRGLLIEANLALGAVNSNVSQTVRLLLHSIPVPLLFHLVSPLSPASPFSSFVLATSCSFHT